MSNTNKIPIGAVLSDRDIREMVERFPDFISVEERPIDFDDKEKDILRPCSVDLTIGGIYSAEEQMIESGQTMSLRPGGVAHIESKERFNMPDNVVGFLVPRNTYSERGLLMLNAGHVDPGWKGNGYLTLEVINLTEKPFNLTVGEDRPCSIIFQYMHSSTTIPTPAGLDEKRRNKALDRLRSWPHTLYSDYLDRIMKVATDKFVTKEELSDTKKEIESKRLGGWTLVGVIAAAAAALVGVIGLAFLFWQLTN